MAFSDDENLGFLSISKPYESYHIYLPDTTLYV